MKENEEFCERIKFKPNSYTKEDLLDLNNREVNTAAIADQIINQEVTLYENYTEELLKQRDEIIELLTITEQKIKEAKEYLLQNKQSLTQDIIDDLSQTITETEKSKKELEESIIIIDEKIEEIEASELQIVKTVVEAINEQSRYSLNYEIEY